MSVIYQLLIAHVLADFFLQTDAMSRGKLATDGTQWRYLALHSLIHAVTAYIFVAQLSCWLVPLVVGVSHFIIDTAKCFAKRDTVGVFIADQIAHVIVIASLALFLLPEGKVEGVIGIFMGYCDATLLKRILAYALVLKPCSILMSKILARWTLPEATRTSLPAAGQWIGYLERVLILTFVFTDNIQCVGFLIAAKSIFRFGDLNKAKDIKTTEYVMIGTMMSFSIAVILGLVVN